MSGNRVIKMWIVTIALAVSLCFTGCNGGNIKDDTIGHITGGNQECSSVSISDIPQYNGKPYVEINDDIPDFTQEEMRNTVSFEHYSDLDSLGRCGTAQANIGTDIMPTEERGTIGQIKPSGWHTVKYQLIDGKFLYNRCHLIGYQLTGENSNKKNLITGTRYMNTKGMLPFENDVADYVKDTDNHVMYRVTPIFHNDELLARGVQIEAYSVEDRGKGICFNVYVYNVQPGIDIDYETGNSSLSSEGQVGHETDNPHTNGETETGDNAHQSEQTITRQKLEATQSLKYIIALVKCITTG